ncbi:phage tail tape measure protein [Rhodanobacter sp. OR87]|uniref:phage tail tape measure protein n=1 Tax=Rhodanobacter sp. OR87 TaxID=1076523 RepID=UPI000412B34C|nr:phage tail tape measure protein [Rhodanobacter sp. OR87]
MFEAYKIGVRISVIDATGGGILKLAMQFNKAEKEAASFLATLRNVNEELRRSAGGWSNSAANGFNNARRAANDYANAASRAARAGGSGLGVVAGMAFAGGAGGGGFGGGTFPALSGPAGHSGAERARRFRAGGAGGAGGTGGGGFGYGPFGAIVGGAMVEHAGKDMFGMLGGPIDEAAKYQQAVAKFSLYGLGDRLNAEAVKFASGMKIFGTSMTDAMEDVSEAQGVFRESGLSGSRALAGAKLAAPMLAKISAATSGLDSESQAKMHTQGLDMLRFIEMRGGLSSPAKFNEIANEGWKAIRSSGGNVAWSQLRQFMSTGSVAAQGLSDKALFGEMEPIIGEMKGGAAGHAFMTAYSRVNGLQRLIPRIMQRDMMNLGLWDKSRLVLNSQGGIKEFKGNPLKDANLFSSSPFEYYKNVVLPAYKKNGITNDQDVFRENAILFGNTGGKMFSIMYRQMEQIENSVKSQQKTLGIDASVRAVKGTFAGQMLNYHKQMQTLQTQLGLVILPMLIKGLKWLNPLLQNAAHWISEHSTLTKGLVILFGAVAGLALVGGSIIAIAGGFTLISGAIAAGGGLATLIGGVGTAMSALTPMVAAFLAAYAGWKAGGFIYDHALAGTKSGDMIGSGIAHTLAFFGNKDAQEAVAMNNRAVTHVTHVHLDGKQIAKVVSHHQANAASRPQSGTSGFDGSMSPIPVGSTGSW